MKTVVSKWGNSYAIRLPKKLVEEYKLLEGSLELVRNPKGIVLKKTAKKEQLRSLLKDMEPQGELDWGAVRGKEVW